MKNRFIIFVVLILLLVALTGCWNKREINTLAVVQAIGIDQMENGEISVTFQILKPSAAKAPAGGGEGGGGEKAVCVLTSTGETLFEAFRNATKESGRKLFIPFNKIIVIGEDAARSGIGELTEFLDRDHECRCLAYILIAKGKAKDIIEASNEQEKIPAKGIENLLKATFATSQIPEMNLHDLHKILSSKTASPFAPGIKTINKLTEDKVKTFTKLEDTAIFKADKLIGWADKKETRGFLWILGKVKSGIIIVNSPQEEEKKVSLEIISSSTEIEPEIKDGKLFITIKIKEEGNIGEQMSENVDLTKPETFKELEKRQAAAIESEINAALTRIQKEWGVDLFNFGQEFHRKFPDEWKQLEKNWDEEIKNIVVEVEVEAKLSKVGLSMYPEEYHEE
jgi:spore germination protein KC